MELLSVESLMDYLVFIIALLVLLWIFRRYFRRLQRNRRAALIDRYGFPTSLREKLTERYPHLQKKDTDRVIAGLREFFHLCNQSPGHMVSMPSQVVDVAWHEFILFTRRYEHFCNKALGRFLHHTPAEAMCSPIVAQDGIKVAWRLSCARERIDRNSPSRLPLLFALDADLQIPDGFHYSLDCKRGKRGDYCAGHIGCGGGCGGDSGDSGGCGGGCGGD